MAHRSLAALAVAALAAGPALAADPATYSPPPPVVAAPAWSGSLTLYGWAAGLNGEEALFGLPPVSVDVSFLDILPHLNFAAMGIAQIQYGQFGFLGELNYVKLSDSVTGPRGFVTAKLDVGAFFGTALGTYRIAEGAWGNIDLMAGLRVFSMSNRITLFPPAPLPVIGGSEGAAWADVVAGVKARFNLSDRWSLLLWGFGGAGGSEYSWDALAAIGYRFDERWSMEAGYRAIGVRYESARFTYDMVQHGPIMGVTFRF